MWCRCFEAGLKEVLLYETAGPKIRVAQSVRCDVLAGVLDCMVVRRPIEK